MSSAKLKQAAEEIKEILKKHDIAGAIGLHTPGHGEYLLHVHTSYSCAYMYEDDCIRFNIASNNPDDNEKRDQCNTDTSNMLKVLTCSMGMNFEGLLDLSKKFDDLTGVVHSPVIFDINEP